MKHDVFISYSSHDKAIADAICSKLENSKVRCWIAPRDILPGVEFGEAIIDALVDCRILLLVFSSKANDSPQVRREVERAVGHGKIIVPFRIEGILPTKAMEFALFNTHWLDAISPPLESHIIKLTNTIYSLLKIEKPLPSPPPLPPPPPAPLKPDPGRYYPVMGILIEDAAGNKTTLYEFAVRDDSYTQLEGANRDVLTIGMGQGTRAVSWGVIETVNIQSRDCVTIKQTDGTTLNNMRLDPIRLVGKDSNGFDFVFDFKNQLKITVLRDTSVPTIEELIRDIPVLSRRADGPAYKNALTLEPAGKEYLVTFTKYFYNEITLSHSFRLPGPHSFTSHDGFVKLKAGGNFSMDRFPHETAKAIAQALTNLNALLSKQNDNKPSSEPIDSQQSSSPQSESNSTEVIPIPDKSTITHSGSQQFPGQIIRKDGSIENFTQFSFGQGDTRYFPFATDMDGKNVRDINGNDIFRIDILGSSRLIENGEYLKNIWAKAKITFRDEKKLENVYLNIAGLVSRAWNYRTDFYLGKIDDEVSSIIFWESPKPVKY